MPVQTERALRTISVVFNLPMRQRFTYRVPDDCEKKIFLGQRVLAPFGNRLLQGYIVADKIHTFTGHPIKDIRACIDDKPLFTDELLSLAGWIADEYGCSEGEALAGFFSLRKPLKRIPLLKRSDRSSAVPRSVILTAGQQRILDAAIASLSTGETKVFLIHGVTGSGKTEVYLRVISRVCEMGTQALYLVPEITMTPLFINHLRQRFGETVAVWHSRLSAGERYAVWQAVHEKKIRVVIGARSAVFLPFAEIGVIIIDEEHDDSYKQDQKPYYHARVIAEKRAKTHKGILILGSATPSVESYRHALNGRYALFCLEHRIDHRPMPVVEMIHLAGALPGRGQDIFSDPLVNAVRQRLARREQVILFINRRGYAPFIRCSACGWVSTCTSCSVSLVYHRPLSRSEAGIYHQEDMLLSGPHRFAHRAENRPDHSGCRESLMCHYCGKIFSLPDRCPACSKGTLRLAGIGTQKVESELRRLFPGARIARLDRDTASHKGYYDRVYDDFKKEDIDILLGTQIVAKGFDFPRVTLVGVVEADTALHVPDFRAAERTFQLVTQVAGRAGRGSLPGTIIVQTFFPTHYALKAASRHDYRTFYEEEIAVRETLGYPPFKRLMRMVLRGIQEAEVRTECERLAKDLAASESAAGEVLGPSPAIRPLLHGKYRWQIIIKSDAKGIKDILDFITCWQVKKNVLLSIEVDPVSLL